MAGNQLALPARWRYLIDNMAAIEMERVRDVATLLGGGRVFRAPILDPDQMRRAIRRGLPYEALEQLIQLLRLDTDEQVTVITGMASRTRARRRVSRRLRPDESDRLYRVARVAARAVQVLGSTEKAQRWLKRRNTALGNDIPLHRLDTEVGTRQVEAILGRIEHGVFS